MFIVLDMKQHFITVANAERQTINVICSNNPLTMVGKCRTYTSADHEPREDPPNITACSSSIMVREKPAQGGGLDPLTDGDDHDPERERLS